MEPKSIYLVSYQIFCGPIKYSGILHIGFLTTGHLKSATKISKYTNKRFLIFPEAQLISTPWLPCEEAQSYLLEDERPRGTEMNGLS